MSSSSNEGWLGERPNSLISLVIIRLVHENSHGLSDYKFRRVDRQSNTQNNISTGNLLGTQERERALIAGGRSTTQPLCFHSFTLAVSELLGLRAPNLTLICILYTRGALRGLRSTGTVMDTAFNRCVSSISSRKHLLLELCSLLTVEASIKCIFKIIVSSFLHHLSVLKALYQLKFFLLHHSDFSL
jgi:hypothetical protein